MNIGKHDKKEHVFNTLAKAVNERSRVSVFLFDRELKCFPNGKEIYIQSFADIGDVFCCSRKCFENIENLIGASLLFRSAGI